MNWIKERVLHPLKKEKQGAAMVLVLCVMILFFVLSLTIVFASGVLVGEAKDDRISKQCRIMAESFAKRVDDAMSVPRVDVEKLDMKILPDFVRANIDRRVENEDIINNEVQRESPWLYYWKPENAGQVRPEGSTTLDGALHTYWVNVDPESSSVMSDAGYSMCMEIYWTFKDYREFWDYMNVRTENYEGILLSIDVVCANGEQSSKVNLLYQLTAARPEDEVEEEFPDGGEPSWSFFPWNWTKVWEEA